MGYNFYNDKLEILKFNQENVKSQGIIAGHPDAIQLYKDFLSNYSS